MSFFKNLGSELGTGTGKGINTLVSKLWKLLEGFLSWLFTPEYKSNEGWMKTNSLRIACWSIILSVIFVPGLVTCSNSNNSESTNSKASEKDDNGKVSVSIQLRKGPESIIPNTEMFTPILDHNSRVYTMVEGKKYYHFMEIKNLGEVSTALVDEPACVIVPAGREIKILVKHPPVFVVNMQNEVEMHVKREKTPYIIQLYLFIKEYGTKDHYTSSKKEPWLYLYNNWADLEGLPEGYFVIKGRALLNNQIKDNIKGGLVCF